MVALCLESIFLLSVSARTQCSSSRPHQLTALIPWLVSVFMFLLAPVLWKSFQTASRSHCLVHFKKKKPYNGCFYHFKESYSCVCGPLTCFDLHYAFHMNGLLLFASIFSSFTLVPLLSCEDKWFCITTLELSVQGCRGLFPQGD